MNICVVSPDKDVRSETFIRGHIERLNATAIFGEFPCYEHDGRPVVPLFLRGGLSVVRRASLPFAGGVRRLAVASVARFLRDHHIDVILAEYGPTAVNLLEPCRMANIPLVVHFHGYDIYRRDILASYRAGYERLFRDAAAMIVGSLAMQRHLIQVAGAADRIVYNPCGVDTDYFRPIEAGRNPPVFVAVGRFVEKKAPHITLLAFREVWTEIPAARLIMIGDGVLLDACKQLAQALGIGSAVEFPGPLNTSAIRDTLQQARGFVQHSVTAPSGDSEGTAISLLEAAATGLPVVSTRHGGIQDTMVHGQTGFLVEELDFRAMAKHMSSLGSDPERATSMGQCARQRVVTTYSMDRSIEGLYRILNHAVESRGNYPL